MIRTTGPGFRTPTVKYWPNQFSAGRLDFLTSVNSHYLSIAAEYLLRIYCVSSMILIIFLWPIYLNTTSILQSPLYINDTD